MFNLLTINNFACPKPANYQVSTSDKMNQFDAEDGTRVLETVREGIYNISVSYTGLTSDKLTAIMAAITKISIVIFYDALTNTLKTKSMEVSGVNASKGYYDNDIIVFNLAFKLDEL